MKYAFNRRLSLALLASAAPLFAGGQAFAQAAADASAPAAEVEQIVVTGSRLVTSGVNMPTPVTVLGQSLITQTAATQIAQVLMDLPSVRSDVTPATRFVGGGGNNPANNLVNLRGLGAVRTLVLVDGVRFPPTSTTESFNLDMIPSSLVQRLEVVTGGASAAYGSDAVAGVVNVILDHNLKGIRGSVEYGETDRGDGQEWTASLAGGDTFKDGRLRVTAGGEWAHRKAVGNCYTRDWCAQEYQVVSNPTPGANGRPALVIAPNSRASQNTPGGLIVSSRLVSAFGGQEVSDDGKSLIPFTFGQLYAPNNNQMIGGSRPGISPYAGGFELQPPQKRWATYLHTEYDFNTAVTGWVDASLGHTWTQGYVAQLRGGNQNAAGTAPAGPLNTSAFALAVDNPFLPAQLATEMRSLNLTSVDIGKSGDGLLRPFTAFDNDTYRLAAGLKGKWGAWRWDGSYFHGQTDQDVTQYQTIKQNNLPKAIQAVTGTGANAGKIVCAVNRTANVEPDCVPLNVFGVGTNSADALAYSFGTAYQTIKIKMDDVAFNVQGEPFHTWAGPVSLATGLEYRTESISSDIDAASAAGVFLTPGASLHGRSKVTEGYLETSVPLATNTSFAKELSVNGAVRRTRYSLSSPQAPIGGTGVGPISSKFTATTWKIGGVYRPTDWLRFRGTISRDFRAPNLNELYTLPTVNNSAVLDPATNTNTQVPTQAGGNPNLRPEIAKTRTVGFSIQPTGALRNLQLSVDYYRIKVTDYIAAVGAPTLVTQCFNGAQDACAFVTRNSTGALTFIRNVSANANQLEVAGTDIELGYKQGLGDIGELQFRVLTTIYHKLEYVNAGQPISGRCQTGVVTQQSFPSMACYQINARVNFTRGPWQAGLLVRYIPGGKYANTLVGPQDAGYNPALANSVSDNRMPDVTYVNLNGSYRFLNRNGHTLEVFGAVNNLFDKDPPPYPANNIGTNALIYDVIGRVYKVGVRFKY